LGCLDLGEFTFGGLPLLALGSYVATDGRDDALGVFPVEGLACAVAA
jgi:hypothetical protein